MKEIFISPIFLYHPMVYSNGISSRSSELYIDLHPIVYMETIIFSTTYFHSFYISVAPVHVIDSSLKSSSLCQRDLLHKTGEVAGELLDWSADKIIDLGVTVVFAADPCGILTINYKAGAQLNMSPWIQRPLCWSWWVLGYIVIMIFHANFKS